MLLFIVLRIRRLVGDLNVRWAAGARRPFPWRDAAATPFQVLTAEVLLKRTTATAAARIYPQFVRTFPSPMALDAADAVQIEHDLRPIGLYRQRAKGFKELARYLQERHGGKVPDTLGALLDVPHLGPYAARAVLSFGFGRRAAVVDSNVRRVLGRLFYQTLGPAPSTVDFQAVADALAPRRDHREFNWGLLDLGATVCRYDRPRCERCPLARDCDTGRLILGCAGGQ